MAADDSHPARAPLQPRSWLRAFVGFYRPQPASQLDLDPVARFLYSARAGRFGCAYIAGLALGAIVPAFRL